MRTLTRFLLRLAVTLASAAIGLLGAAWIVPGFSVHAKGFIIATVVLAVLQALLSPLVSRLIGRFIPALEGGIGIISTTVALLVAGLIPAASGISAQSLGTWLFAGFVVWLVTALATVVLAWILARTSGSSSTGSAT